MKNFNFFLFTTLFFLFSCSSLKTTILEGEDVHIMHASARAESQALEGAKQECEKFCALRSKRAIFIDSKTKYQGMDKNLKAIGNAINFKGGVYVPVTSPDDHKVTIKFKCI